MLNLLLRRICRNTSPSFLFFKIGIDMLIPTKLYGFLCNLNDTAIDLKDDTLQKVKNTTQYISNNPDKIILGISVLASLFRASQSLVVSHRNLSQRRYADRSYYDAHTHTKWRLRRPLTNFEKKTLNIRQANGESVVDILEEMGVLK